MTTRLLVLCGVLLMGVALVAKADRIEPIAARESFARFPMTIDAWSGRRAADFDSKILTLLGVDEYLNRSYQQPSGVPLGLYIGYYQSQRQGDAIHSPLNCLPGAGWLPVSKSDLPIQVKTSRAAATTDRTIVVNRYVIAKGEQKQLVLYWYQSQGRVIASEYWSKFYMVWDAVRTNRTDAALVRVIVPLTGGADTAEAAAEAAAKAFVQSMFPLLGEYLPS
jgi:EpsI family protein